MLSIRALVTMSTVVAAVPAILLVATIVDSDAEPADPPAPAVTLPAPAPLDAVDTFVRAAAAECTTVNLEVQLTIVSDGRMFHVDAPHAIRETPYFDVGEGCLLIQLTSRDGIGPVPAGRTVRVFHIAAHEASPADPRLDPAAVADIRALHGLPIRPPPPSGRDVGASALWRNDVGGDSRDGSIYADVAFDLHIKNQQATLDHPRFTNTWNLGRLQPAGLLHEHLIEMLARLAEQPVYVGELPDGDYRGHLSSSIEDLRNSQVSSVDPHVTRIP